MYNKIVYTYRGINSNERGYKIMMTKKQKELKKKLIKLEIDPFLIDRIIKFYPVTISYILKRKEVNYEKAISKY